MTLVSAGDLVKNLALLEKKITWIKCPLCSDEVNRLRPCTFWAPVKSTSNVCVECAETVKGLTFLAGKYPIPGIDVETSLLPLYQKMPQKYRSERSYKARVFIGDWGFMVWPESTSLSVLEDRKSPDQKKQYDNTHQVWFALKKQFEEGKKEEEVLPGNWR